MSFSRFTSNQSKSSFCQLSPGLERLRLVRLVTSLSLLISLSLPLFVGFAQSAPAAVGTDQRLSQLEVKFFKHTYPKDEESVRLERLEKMIFGEVKSGAGEQRLKNLADTVPNLGAVVADDDSKPDSSVADNAQDSNGSSSGSRGSSRSGRGPKPVANANSDLDLSEERTQGNKPGGQVLSGESKYPAVTALEQSILKRDYAAEPVADRLNRLETKVFGHPSKFTDLSERVDALKEKTRVDIAKQAPAGSDWLDDEDDDINFSSPKKAQSPVRSTPVPRTDGDDGRSFSGRDLRKDMQAAFGTRPSSSGGGYGMGRSSGSSSSSNAASGSYGMGGGGVSSGAGVINDDDDDMPAAAPRRTARGAPRSMASSANGNGSDRFASDSGGAAPVGAIGLSSKVTALENAVLGKTYSQDPLIERVGRLEDTVFPKKTDVASSLSLPERVAKLVEKVPVASAPPKTARANRGRKDDMDFDDDLDMGTSMSSMGGMSSLGSMGGMTTQSQTSRSGGLGKIINSLGNMLGGGYGTYGGYSTGYGIPGTGAMVRDPSTGFLVDQTSGNLINPTTGQVVGRSSGYPTNVYTNGISQYGTGFGTGFGGMPAGFGYPTTVPGVPVGGYSSFNNGFSPYGYPGGGYGMGGFGNSGIRFGGGNFGVRF